MKKATIKRISRFMRENNICIADVTEVTPILYKDGFKNEYRSIGPSLVQGDEYAPQWVHNVIRKIAGMPKFTASHPRLGWWELLSLYRRMHDADDFDCIHITCAPIMDIDDYTDADWGDDDWDE